MTPREQILTSEQVSDRLSRLDGWRGTTSSISKDYRVGYDTAIRIVAEIGKAAIELEHRPDIDIRWDRLHISMTTHTAGDVVTELDFLLAVRLDAIVQPYSARSGSKDT
jgi:4a-hydroxytetrahydrobiopterin dehydratase